MGSWNSKCHASPNKRQQCSVLSHPISKPKHQDFTHINEWILIADIYNFSFPPAAFEDDAISVPVSAATAASCYWYVLISVLSGDKHLIRVYASQRRHVFPHLSTYVQIDVCTFELYDLKEKVLQWHSVHTYKNSIKEKHSGINHSIPDAILSWCRRYQERTADDL